MKSCKILYWYFKIMTFVIVLLPVTAIFSAIIKEEFSHLVTILFPLMLFLGFAVFVFLIVDDKLRLVELTQDGIVTNDEVIAWINVHKITFTFFGFYRVKYQFGWFWLSPATLPRTFLGINLNKDEFNACIEQMKKKFKY